MYHMYGSSMGALNVYHGNPSSGTSIWTMEGDQGDQWNHASVIVGGWTSMSTVSDSVNQRRVSFSIFYSVQPMSHSTLASGLHVLVCVSLGTHH